MDDPETERAASKPAQPSAPITEAQRASDGLKGQIAALRDQVRQARADLLSTRRKPENRSFED
jgi:hypothetical protein